MKTEEIPVVYRHLFARRVLQHVSIYIYILGVQKSSELFFVKFNLYRM